MAGTYSIVRPYPGTLGEKIEALVTGLDLTPALGQPPAAGTPDEYTARWVSRNTAQLLVVPFHFHRGTAQDRLDGIGVLLALPSTFDLHGRVLFMPVRDFSWSTSFAPRFELLRKKRPELTEKILVAHEGELDTAALAIRLKRAIEAARDQRSRPPSVVPRRRGVTRSGVERFSSEPTTERRSGAWKFSLPPDPATPTIPPHSGSRPIGQPPRTSRPGSHRGSTKKKSNG